MGFCGDVSADAILFFDVLGVSRPPTGGDVSPHFLREVSPFLLRRIGSTSLLLFQEEVTSFAVSCSARVTILAVVSPVFVDIEIS